MGKEEEKNLTAEQEEVLLGVPKDKKMFFVKCEWCGLTTGGSVDLEEHHVVSECPGCGNVIVEVLVE